jgi:hypothetical protein
MKIIELFDILGIIVLMFGGLIGVIGNFKEKNDDIVSRTSSSFGNIEFYDSMITQKYHNILSFIFIFFGSMILLIPYLLNELILSYTLPFYNVFLISWITLLIIIYIVFTKQIKFKIHQITVRNQIIILNQKKPEIAENDYNLKLIKDIFKEKNISIDNLTSKEIIEKAELNFKINN